MDLWDQIKSYLPQLGLGIPQGEVRRDLPTSAFMPPNNAAGDVVFPTNALERGLQSSDSPTKDYAAAFLGAPGLKLPPISGPIRAYHGSPYDFNKFSLENIGTGEGAQAYGHGLYFAENPEVAQQYRDALVAQRKTPLTKEEYEGFKATKTPINQGRMYEVNINAKPEQFLQWDRPVSEQPGVMAKLPPGIADKYAAAPDMYLGQTVLGDLSKDKFGITHYPLGSQRLSEAGIPGIRYLDQGSRVRAEPRSYTKGWIDPNSAATSNYVVFNPDIVDILKKYGIAGMLGGSMLGGPQNNQPTLGFQ